MSFRSAEGSKYIDDVESFVKYPTSQGEVAFPAGLTAGVTTVENTGIYTPLLNVDNVVATADIQVGNELIFPDASVQTTAYLGKPTPVVYNQPVGPATASGTTLNLFFNQVLVTGGVYAVSVSVECKADVGGQSLDDYKVYLSYNNVDLCRTQIYGVGDADAIISVPMTGYFVAVDPNTTLIKCAVTCTTSGGGTWNITADTILNLVRLA